MHHAWLEIELLEDCVFSARAATEGAHESLDRIPGAALLGAAATRLYGDLGADAFTAFHSGRLRFGDGLPASPSGAIGWPVPLAWHHPKNAALEDRDGYLDGSRLYNLARMDEIPPQKDGPVQPKQMRQGYVTRYGEWVRPSHDLRLKTAIEAATGRAAQGQLFGYDALHRGQRFRALIEADEAVDEALFQRVVDALTGEVLLGRSRSAEYGRARLTRVEAEPPRPGDPAPDGRITLWLLSDLALADEDGQPTLQPTPGHFGLSGGEIVWDRTFLRARRYSPWNAARGGFDRERLVLAAGGVVTIRPPEGYDRDALTERLAPGVGLHREAGLGRLWLDPPLLSGERPGFERPPATADVPPPATSAPDHPLIAWLEAQDIDWKQRAEEAARSFVEDYRGRITVARKLNGTQAQADFGPSKSQWGRVLHTAKGPAARTAQGLRQALFEGENAVIKANGEGWSIEMRDGEGYGTLAAWLSQRLTPGHFGNPKGDRAYAHFVRIAARRIQDDIDRRKG